MNRASQIIRTSVIGIIANVMLAAFKTTVGVYAVSTGSHRRTELQNMVIKTLSGRKDILQLHGFYYYEQDNRLSIDVVPDISVTDESAFAAMLTDDLHRLILGVKRKYKEEELWRGFI